MADRKFEILADSWTRMPSQMGGGNQFDHLLVELGAHILCESSVAHMSTLNRKL